MGCDVAQPLMNTPQRSSLREKSLRRLFPRPIKQLTNRFDVEQRLLGESEVVFDVRTLFHTDERGRHPWGGADELQRSLSGTLRTRNLRGQAVRQTGEPTLQEAGTDHDGQTKMSGGLKECDGRSIERLIAK